LRTFALERVSAPALRDEQARDIADAELDAELAAGYGIFAGAATERAVLRFTPLRARWVADEIWHPAQETRWLEDGRYELSVPYANPRELMMDILRHGADCEVVAPPTLRTAVRDSLEAARRQYDTGD